MQNSMMLLTFFVFDPKYPFWTNLVKKKKNCQFKVKLDAYNLGHNILEIYNVLVQIQLSTSKMNCDIYYSKLGTGVVSRIAERLTTENLRK